MYSWESTRDFGIVETCVPSRSNPSDGETRSDDSLAKQVTRAAMSSALAAPAGSGAPSPLLTPLVLDVPGFLDRLGLKNHTHST